MNQFKTLTRGSSSSSLQQFDFHLEPLWVEGGDEAKVCVVTGKLGFSNYRILRKISSFLGVMPGDEVEMAVDVVDSDGIVLYTRSIHKECRGIYDAWHASPSLWYSTKELNIVVTCRVNGPNRDGDLKAFFEGLVRIEVT